jgi:hypothetical protein
LKKRKSVKRKARWVKNPYFCGEKAEGSYGRVLGRSNNNGNANGGVAYANANNASSNANTNYGSRLANNKRVGHQPKNESLLRHISTRWRIAEGEEPEPQQQRHDAGKLENHAWHT